MHIEHLSLGNFRGFEQFELDLHPRCTVLAGVNGAGKSSVLDALEVVLGSWLKAVGTGSDRPIREAEVRRVMVLNHGQADLEPRWPVRVEGGARFGSEEVITLGEVQSQTERKAPQPELLARLVAGFKLALKEKSHAELPLLASYGAVRHWTERAPPQQKNDKRGRLEAYEGCLSARPTHQLFEAWMAWREGTRIQGIADFVTRRAQAGVSVDYSEAVASAADPLLEAVERAAARCVDAKRFAYHLGHKELRLTRADDTVVPFSLLSDGYRGFVALVADLAWRAVRLNPHLGSAAPEATEGVVLIDEIELHLHPQWQRSVLPTLMSIFPRLQFVVTTHSPQVIASAERAMVRLLDGGPLARSVPPTFGRDSNSLLEDVMATPARPVWANEALNALFSALERGELAAAQAQIATLRPNLGPDDPDLVRAQWLLDAEQGG